MPVYKVFIISKTFRNWRMPFFFITLLLLISTSSSFRKYSKRERHPLYGRFKWNKKYKKHRILPTCCIFFGQRNKKTNNKLIELTKFKLNLRISHSQRYQQQLKKKGSLWYNPAIGGLIRPEVWSKKSWY